MIDTCLPSKKHVKDTMDHTLCAPCELISCPRNILVLTHIPFRLVEWQWWTAWQRRRLPWFLAKSSVCCLLRCRDTDELNGVSKLALIKPARSSSCTLILISNLCPRNAHNEEAIIPLIRLRLKVESEWFSNVGVSLVWSKMADDQKTFLLQLLSWGQYKANITFHQKYRA